MILLFLSLVGCAFGFQNTTGFTHDPYLQYRPAFTRSLPVQILLTGVVLTLVAVLFIHLIFTAQYHWPLAPVNYVLQLSGVTTLLISLIATLHVVLSTTLGEAQRWPYMLNYVAVDVPPSAMEIDDAARWSLAERATWLVMNASTSGLIQITHIQFLTLLFPSRLEGRLIFALLIPLAVVAAIMQLLPLINKPSVIETASDARNVCNATLSLLFTSGLFLWGLIVNRAQAWRLDGGTAAFGCAALSLAVVSTALNLLYIRKEEEFVWLPGLMWAVVLWQNFLGWWWWVGSGSGSGMANWDLDKPRGGVEELMRREEKRQRLKREKMERRKQNTKRARTVWRGVAGAFVPTREGGDSDDISSTGTLESGDTLPRFFPSAVQRWYASLRRAHVAATRQQAVERVQRIRELTEERNGSNRTSRREVHSQGNGWGLGSFGWRLDTPHSQTQPSAEQDIEMDDVGTSAGRNTKTEPLHATQSNHAPVPDRRPQNNLETKKVWWWGPLRRWRLQDSTAY